MSAWGRHNTGEGGRRIAIDAASTANVNYVPRFSVFDSEVWGCCSHELERRCVVESNYCIPLLVRHLHNLNQPVIFHSFETLR